MKTKEELLKQKSDLLKVIKEEDEILAKKFKKVIENAAGFEINLRFERREYSKELYMRVAVPYEDIDLDFSIDFEERREWISNKLKPDSGLMNINYGTYGSHTKLNKNGKLKLYDILIGKVWEVEDDLTDLYNSIDWTNENKLFEINHKIYEIKEEEKDRIYQEEKRQREEKINNVINSFHIGMVIYTLWQGYDVKIEKITNDYVYFNIPYSFRGWKQCDKKKRYTKEELARELIRRDNL